MTLRITSRWALARRFPAKVQVIRTKPFYTNFALLSAEKCEIASVYAGVIEHKLL